MDNTSEEEMSSQASDMSALSKAQSENIDLLNAGGTQQLRQILRSEKDWRLIEDVDNAEGEENRNFYSRFRFIPPEFTPEEEYTPPKRLKVEQTNIKLNYCFRIVRSLESTIDKIT